MSTDTSPTLDPADTDTDEPVDEPVFADTVTEPPPADSAQAGPTTRRAPRPWYRPRWKPLFLRLHRWISFAFLIPVLLWFVSGVVFLYQEPLLAALNPSAPHGTASANPIGPAQAAAVVQSAFLDDRVTVAINHGGSHDSMIEVSHRSADGVERISHVDRGTGRLLESMAVEDMAPQTGAGTIGFVYNLHDCALSCEGAPGYLPFMAKNVPGTNWQASSVVIVLVGFFTAFLAVSGLVLWWPGLRRWTRGFQLRRKSFYVFNFDLHHVLGFAAIPFVLMWGLTTMSFLVTPLRAAWFAVTATHHRTNAEFDQTYATLLAAERASGPEVDVAQAERNARAVAPGVTDLCGIIFPDPDNGMNAYDLFFRSQHLPCGWGVTEVIVSHQGGQATSIAGHGRPWAETAWWNWWLELHKGYILGQWGALIWAFFGLSSVVLIFTGVVMWWRRWRNRRRRAAALTTASAV